MKVQTYKELEDLIPKVESDLEEAIKERESLDLSVPQNYKVQLMYYNSENAKANASDTCLGRIICINTLPSITGLLKGEDENKLSFILKYFDIVRTFLGYEGWILQAMQDPAKTIENFEKAFQSEQSFQQYKEGFKSRGREYDDYKDFMTKNAEPVKKALEDLLPKIRTVFEKADLSLRHEMDHLDFFTSNMHEDTKSKLNLVKNLQHKLHIEKDLSVSKEYAKANMDLLKIMVEVNPIVETRAMFFNHIRPDEWGKADFEKVKNKVYGNFLLGYIEHSYPREILDPLISQKWSTGEMDTATSMFLFYTVNSQMQSANSQAYIVQPEKVNYEIANKILYQEIPEWKMKLAKNARKVVETIGKAYKENPSRLKEANYAKTFEEFIEKCRG